LKKKNPHSISLDSNTAIEPFIDAENYLDMSLCSMPTEFGPALSYCDPTQFSSLPVHHNSPAMDAVLGMALSGSNYNHFLAPWPGSLAAAYQGIPTA
jgi:hypothetical protein